MEIILLEKVKNLGVIGSRVNVKAGYARNYLIPQHKAVRATNKNLENIEKNREQLELKEKETLNRAIDRKTMIEKLGIITIPAKASEEGKLFGSIGTRDIAHALSEKNIEVLKSEVKLPQGPIRLIGEYEIDFQLHTDVIATIKVKIVPSV